MGEYFQLLRRDLTGSLPAPQWPPGMLLDHYHPQRAPAIHAVLSMAQDGSGVGALEEWRQQFVTDAEFDPMLCLVVSDATGVLGVAQCWTSAFIKNLAIHPCAQGMGLGRALLLHAFQVFKQRGEAFVDLKVLESNIRARKLYESAGMQFVLRDRVTED